MIPKLNAFPLLLISLLITLSASTRVITPEELSQKTTKSQIWLSVMGSVYDVTPGHDYYGPGSTYSFFAGKDATTCFATGRFTQEEMNRDLETLTLNELNSIHHWKKFYAEHEMYQFMGVLEGRFYDKDGKMTHDMEVMLERMKTLKTD